MRLVKVFIQFLFLTTSFVTQQINSQTIVRNRPADYEYLSLPDSTGNRQLLKTAVSSTNEKTEAYDLKLPYPIIFIHGLNSNADTWATTTNFLSSQYGLQNGGRFDYCLNNDNDNSKANTNFYPMPGADIALFSGTWVKGDFYYLNFSVGIDGSYDPGPFSSVQVWSNQSAITKQGVALRDAINKVLQLTGRDKVILVGHSMGGLASRSYLQNPNTWQQDGTTHVAKLLTTGTPHGGSNSPSFGLATGNTNGQSEAMRDLRTTYYYSNNPGVFLFGGTENLSYMNDQLCCSFYNADVNCNGTDQETIIGLNQKTLYNNLDYACIIGECSGCVITTNAGDGVVPDLSANLNTFYPNSTANTFTYNASAVTEIHTDLPSQYYQNMQGLDEPEAPNLAYNIAFDTKYLGFLTIPSNADTTAPYDVDTYSFSTTKSGKLTVTIDSIISSLNFKVTVLDSNQHIIDSALHVSGTTLGINTTSSITKGNYYLQTKCITNTTSYLKPYQFKLHFSPQETSSTFDMLVFPNPSNGIFTIQTNTSDNYLVNVCSVDGKLILNETENNNTTLNLSDCAAGVYILTIKTTSRTINKKLIIVHP